MVTRDDRGTSCTSVLDHALKRVLTEIHDGLRHGYFEYVITCEIIGQSRRRLTIDVGKTYQFTIPVEECANAPKSKDDSCNGSDDNAD